MTVGDGPHSTWSYRLDDVLAQHATERPASVATVCGNDRWTWAQTHARCHRLAAELDGAGVGSGDRVLWLGQNCHRLLELLFAASRIGAIVCTANWRLSDEELEFVVADCDPRVILWQHREIGAKASTVRASRAAPHALWIQHDGTDADGYEARIQSRKGAQITATSGTDAHSILMMYTAAFDGTPNGALLSHRALLAQSMTLRLLEGIDAKTVYLNSGPMFHIGSLRRTVAVSHAGGRNVMCRRVDAEELCALIDHERCTGAFLQPPTMAQMVAVNADRRYDLSSLVGTRGPVGWAEMVTVVDDSARVRSGYGQTEVAGVVTYHFPGSASVGARPGPLAVVQVHDAHGAAVLPGELGEIVVRGPMVMNGYHNRAELSALRARGGWHHTNDLGRLEFDGSISFVGPIQRIIKSAAENIYPAEVEAALARHPSVRDVAVLGIPDDVWGQRVKAVVVIDDSTSEQELAGFCRKHLAGYKCPRAFAFVALLPRSDGALDRNQIDAQFGGGGYPGISRPRE